MKKVFKMNSSFFLEGCPKNISKIGYRLLTFKWCCFLLIGMSSCSVQNSINKDNFKRIPKHFSAVFYDKPDTIRNQYDNGIRIRSLIKDFTEVTNINYDKPIEINCKERVLFLRFEDTNSKQHVLQFHGVKHKKRFVFYTNYETISFPILFMEKQMTKYSVSLSNEDELIFQNQNVSEGMFLFFGAGNSWQFDYKFKLLKNE